MKRQKKGCASLCVTPLDRYTVMTSFQGVKRNGAFEGEIFCIPGWTSHGPARPWRASPRSTGSSFRAQRTTTTARNSTRSTRPRFELLDLRVLDKDAKVSEVVWDSPAFKTGRRRRDAGAVNAVAYKTGCAKQAIKEAQTQKKTHERAVSENPIATARCASITAAACATPKLGASPARGSG